MLPDPSGIQDDMNKKKYKVVLATALFYSTEGKFFRDISSTIKSLFYMKISNYDKKIPILQELVPFFNPTFHRLVKVIKKFDIELQEIRPGNVGFVNRNGKEQFVILDSSKIAALIIAREGGQKYY